MGMERQTRSGVGKNRGRMSHYERAVRYEKSGMGRTEEARRYQNGGMSNDVCAMRSAQEGVIMNRAMRYGQRENWQALWCQQ